MTSNRMINLSTMTQRQLEEFRNRYDLFIFDKDGCLTSLLDQPLDGTQKALNAMGKCGKELKVLTDNCLSTWDSISSGIHRLFPEIKKEDVMNCGYLLMKHLKEINFNKKIYVLSVDNSIDKELRDSGFDVLHDDEVRKVSMADVMNIELDPEVGAVVVASDVNFNYLKLAKAASYLADPDVLLFYTHYPLIARKNPTIPGVGTLVAAVKSAASRTEGICSGKGSEIAIKYLTSLSCPVERCIFVGDGLPNDIHTGNLAGMDTLFVLSGSCTLEDVEKAKKDNRNTFIPTYYTNSVADLYDIFK